LPDHSIRFGPELTSGKWRGYSHSTRFILLELGRLCRPTEGWCRLPPARPRSRSPIARTIDLLDTSRRVVGEALMALTSDGADGVLPTIVYQQPGEPGYVAPTEAAPGALLLVIPGWLDLFGPTGSALRMRRMRARRKADERDERDASGCVAIDAEEGDVGEAVDDGG
jgi:hypothetical protein